MAKNIYAINSHEARSNAIDNGNAKLAELIWKVWEVCEEADPYWECDEESIGGLVDFLNDEGRMEMAYELFTEVAAEYGNRAA